MEDTLLKFAGDRYNLHAWVIMPNHVHLLITPTAGNALSKIMHSLKSYTAHQANRILHRQGEFWQREYFDRYIRGEEHFAATIRYIEHNPVKAALCESPADWRFSSALKRQCTSK